MNEAQGWHGSWTLAILMMVAASWILYRYAAPRSWREWQGAGLVQAFIIALYAEMYGFPLTLYVLTGMLGVKIPFVQPSGHLWATLLGLGTAGQIIEMLIGFALVFFGIGLLAKGWYDVYRASRDGRLATTGPYAAVRHPQYLGIFIALLGQLIHWPTIPTLVLFPFIVAAYVHLAKREERELVSRFGENYLRYRAQVPMFWPHRGRWKNLFGAPAPTEAESAP
jgi:protein-S-isoprenylcysteine O-methyltransferase Ste14